MCDRSNAAECLGKISFNNPQLANKVMRRRAKFVKGNRQSQVYRCAHCGNFHIGTKTKSTHTAKRRDNTNESEGQMI